VLQRRSTFSFPHLSSLEVEADEIDLSTDTLPNFYPSVLPGCATSLQHVNFACIEVDLDSLKSAVNLREAFFDWFIEVEDGNDPVVPPDINEWIEFLSWTPELRYLSLINAISPPSPPAKTECPPISLNNLRGLGLADVPRIYASFASRLIIPHSCGLVLGANTTKKNATDTTFFI
jgi:hypothetical protein